MSAYGKFLSTQMLQMGRCTIICGVGRMCFVKNESSYLNHIICGRDRSSKPTQNAKLTAAMLSSMLITWLWWHSLFAS